MQVSLRQVEVKSLKLAHLDSIMEIEPRAYGSHHWSRQSFVNELTGPAGSYIGAFDQETDKLLGYTGYWLVGDEAHITTLAVHPDFRREYVGERLLVKNVLSARKNGALWLTLEVRTSNEAAKQLYFKYGFKNLGVRKRYYQDNSEDALVLWTDRISDNTFIRKFVSQAITLGFTKSELEEVLLPAKEKSFELSELASA